jgi:hypothetical protein
MLPAEKEGHRFPATFFSKGTLDLRELCCIATDVGLILREIKSAG